VSETRGAARDHLDSIRQTRRSWREPQVVDWA
jgi:hypothetical protein